VGRVAELGSLAIKIMRMSNQEIAFFTEQIASSTNYLEYGSGGSTKLAARETSVRRITSVESDPGFLESAVFPDLDIQKAILDSRLKFLVADIGPTGEWGVPKDATTIHLWPNYSLCPYMHGSIMPDLILVDGRFRIACCLVAALQAPAATVLVHDYTIRPYYHILENYFEIEEKVDTLVKFRRPHCFDSRSAQILLNKYVYLPRDDRQTPQARVRRFLLKVKHRLTKKGVAEARNEPSDCTPG